MQSNLVSTALFLKLKKIQGLFKDLHRNSRTFQGKMEFKDFSRTPPKIQGLFKTVRTLQQQRNENELHRSSTCQQRRGSPHKLHHGRSLTLPPVDQLHTNGRLNLKHKYQCSPFLRRMFSILRANVHCS